MAKKKHYGICHICGKNGLLTYEHIPPEATFNDCPRKLTTIENLMKDEKDNRAPWDDFGLQYTQFQRGIGFYTLCERCNSFTGAKYGNVYSAFVQSIGNDIMKIPKHERKNGMKVHVEKMNVLAFFKQVLSMFCSINSEDFGSTFKEFLLNENNTDFNDTRYRICMYLHAGKVDRLIPLQGQLDTVTKEFCIFSEISTFPFGFIFYDISDKKETELWGRDITVFAKCEYDSVYNIDITIPFLECNTPFGLDFRTFS